MKRLVQMPFTGNPYLLALWVRLYLERWKGEVDGVLVLINGDNMDPAVRNYCEYILEAASIKYIYSNTRLSHGTAIDLLLSMGAASTYTGLVEEDGFIFKCGQVDYCFRILESDVFDIVAGRRGSCSAWLIELGKKLWYTEDHGPNFWPNFFFSKTQTLLQTDRQFDAKTWQPGETVLHIDGAFDWEDKDYKDNELTVGDTFVNTSLQLRSTIPQERIMLLPQYHCVPADLEDYAKKDQVFDGRCPWIHVGSLSSWYNLLMTDSLPEDPGCDPSEWERRVAFFALFRDEHWHSNNAIANLTGTEPAKLDFLKPLAGFGYRYEYGLNRMIRGYNLNSNNITRRMDIYRDLMAL